MGREVGGGIGMGKTCEPKAFSFQCMTKFTTKKKKKMSAVALELRMRSYYKHMRKFRERLMPFTHKLHRETWLKLGTVG